MKAYTDYPFVELGDIPRELAPVRECKVVHYDGDKYCRILVEGVFTEVKAGYLYKTPGRLGEVESINPYDVPIKGEDIHNVVRQTPPNFGQTVTRC